MARVKLYRLVRLSRLFTGGGEEWDLGKRQLGFAFKHDGVVMLVAGSAAAEEFE